MVLYMYLVMRIVLVSKRYCYCIFVGMLLFVTGNGKCGGRLCVNRILYFFVMMFLFELFLDMGNRDISHNIDIKHCDKDV